MNTLLSTSRPSDNDVRTGGTIRGGLMTLSPNAKSQIMNPGINKVGLGARPVLADFKDARIAVMGKTKTNPTNMLPIR